MEHDGCKGCKYEHCSSDSKECIGCKQNAIDRYVRMTWGDKIRSMSDEQLLEFLRNYFTCEYECAAAKAGCERDCDGTIMKWLQSEVEG